MHAIAEIIRLAPTIFGLVSVINNLLLVGGCILLSKALFRLKMRNPPVTLIICAVLCAGVGVFRPFAASSGNDNMMTLFSTLLLLLPFGCMAIVFCKKGLWKSMLTVAGYTFAESVKFLLLFPEVCQYLNNYLVNYDWLLENPKLHLPVRQGLKSLGRRK